MSTLNDSAIKILVDFFADNLFEGGDFDLREALRESGGTVDDFLSDGTTELWLYLTREDRGEDYAIEESKQKAVEHCRMILEEAEQEEDE